MLVHQRETVAGDLGRFFDLMLRLKAHYGSNARKMSFGKWIIEVGTRKKRSQLVWLTYKKQMTGGTNAARIVAHSPIGPLPRRISREWLLRKNALLDVGAICIADYPDPQKGATTYLMLRATHLLSTADEEELFEMVQKVARVADRLECEIYAHDKH